MSESEQNQTGLAGATEAQRSAARRAIWRAALVSLIVLAIGLFGIWIVFIIREQMGVAQDVLSPLPHAAPIEKVAPTRARLFFTAEGASLVPEMREIEPSGSTYERLCAILDALLRGPQSSGLRSPIPPGVKALGVFIKDDLVTLNLSSELRDGLRVGGLSEVLCVYSIVDTVLLNCPDLKTVTVLVEGRSIETLRGYVDLTGPLVENLAVVGLGRSSQSP
ncbi:GerMN domain-containing protein [Candidatus Sumerlaeota bacterium]|nr:GerMN domain-containing protein [Candidatus Sumerlaeota bacterium]